MSTSSIADSSAITVDRVLPHHQAAITVLVNVLFPRVDEGSLEWLDLACGKGQVIAHLQHALPDDQMRSKISFFGFDIENEYVRETKRLGAKINLGSVDGMVGDLTQFATLVDSERSFSFITFTNTLHELPPVLLGSLLLHLLKPKGILYIADMESLSPLELGAVPWDQNDVKRVIDFLYKLLGSKESKSVVQRWPHKSCFGWSVQIERSAFEITTAELKEKLPAFKLQLEEFITNVFRERLDRTIEALEALTESGGGQTAEEINTKSGLLYEHWGLSRFFGAKS
jgi:SAM-dependent methyltransferase